MPLKKSKATASKIEEKTMPKVKAKVATTQKAHKHADLEATIAELKKEIEALRGQCHSCCAELSELRSASSAKDDRLDEILSVIKEEREYRALRKFVSLKL